MSEIECIACGSKLELPCACGMDGCNNELNSDEGSVILCDGTGNLHICMDCARKITEEHSCGCGCEEDTCED
jgi:hypothetical protein